jgi:hypothetical protein
MTGPLLRTVRQREQTFVKGIDGKPLFSDLYGMYTVPLNELKPILKVSVQGGKSGVVNKTTVELTAQDDNVHEVCSAKGRIFNNMLYVQYVHLTNAKPIHDRQTLPLIREDVT